MMKIIRKGSTGYEVEKWQTFLRGLTIDNNVVVNSIFDDATDIETKTFQDKNNLIPDGIVGSKTISVALQFGYPLMDNSELNMSGPNWPSKPPTTQLSLVEREKLFGKFSFTPTPSKVNPEGITIIDDWAKKNISNVTIPQLSGVVGFPKSSIVQVHAAISSQFLNLFKAWDDAGLKNLIMTWGGSWAPRFIRGSRSVLSNHAWATAFDINVQWNMLGAQPALRGEKGSVRDLVLIAYDHGFYWGGWFPRRLDGMHFEAYKVM